ncbi:15171_t:CDS:2, partial [Acaulospora colombiana]
APMPPPPSALLMIQWTCFPFLEAAVTASRVLGKWNYEAHEQMMKLKPEVYDHSLFWNVRNPFLVPDESIMNLIREGKKVIIHRAEITKLSEKEVYLSDGTSFQTDMLIHATGYNTHNPIFSEKDSLDLGLPVRIDHLASLDDTVQYPTSQSIKADEQ